jgi:hypothetical protein
VTALGSSLLALVLLGCDASGSGLRDPPLRSTRTDNGSAPDTGVVRGTPIGADVGTSDAARFTICASGWSDGLGLLSGSCACLMPPVQSATLLRLEHRALEECAQFAAQQIASGASICRLIRTGCQGIADPAVVQDLVSCD